MNSDSSNGSSRITSPAWSIASTSPELTITFEDGTTKRGEDFVELTKLELDEPSPICFDPIHPAAAANFLPILSNQPNACSQRELSTPQIQPIQSQERPKSLTFNLPPTRDSDNDGPESSSCPRPAPPTRAKTAVDAPLFHAAPAQKDGCASAPNGSPLIVSTPELRPKLDRSSSSFFGSLGRNLSSTSVNMFFGKKKDKKGSPPQQRKKSDPSPEQSDTPEVKALFKNGHLVPNLDLEAVNRALEALRSKAVPENDPHLLALAQFALDLDKTKTDCRNLLNAAMNARQEDKPEMCRGMCIQIIHNNHADIETRVYAYNILSTLASPGRGMDFLKEGEKLLLENGIEKPERRRLLDTVHVMMEAAKVKDEKSKCKGKGKGKGNGKGKEKVVEEDELAGPVLEMPSTSKRVGVPATPTSLLELPTGKSDDGTTTPRTEQIIRWAT